MITDIEDIQDITEARSRFNAYKTDSGLIAWICSDEWTDTRSASDARGHCDRGDMVLYCDTVSGEISR